MELIPFSAVPFAHDAQRAQPAFTPVLAFRPNEKNPNHHLWCNNGTWFMHYTSYPTPLTKERIRRSLGTKDIRVARVRRDEFLQGLSFLRPVPAGSAPETDLALFPCPT